LSAVRISFRTGLNQVYYNLIMSIASTPRIWTKNKRYMKTHIEGCRSSGSCA
jgi:hypothetical protein